MTADPSQHLLAVEHLSVQLPGPAGTVRAVERVSFTVARGRTLALVGESGCGKSMLCRALLGIQPRGALLPGPGRILFEGRDLARLPEREISRIRGREIGVVLQNPMSSLNPVLTVGRQIVEPMLFHLALSRRAARARALELLQAVGLPRPRQTFDSHPHQLSGGMRQRVAIAIALSCDPKLLIADEPTTALDVTVQAEILNLLGRLQKEREMALILVSHDLAVVAGRADETAVMYAGRIVEKAPTRDIFRSMRMPYTKALFDAIPRLDAPPGRALRGIGGRPPDLAAPLGGCPFAPRCDRAGERCRKEEPQLQGDCAAAHSFACWFPIPAPPCVTHHQPPKEGL